MTFLEDAIKRVKDYDESRPRSSQAAVGWSELGGCRAALGYRLSGAWPSDETDGWAASRGTGLHEYLEPILATDGIRTEVDTTYRDVPGHADLVGPDWVGDIKTKTKASSAVWRRDPSAMRQARIQTHGYAAGLIDAGELPAESSIRILVAVVDGTYSDWWCFEEPFDRALADEGIERLEEARAALAEGRPLPKDKPLFFCQSYCPYFTMCRAGDDPDAAEEITDPELSAAVAEYGETTQQISRLYKVKDGLADQIRGLRGTAGDWRISLSRQGEPKHVIDTEWVEADYAARGEQVPMVEKAGSAPRLSVTRIKRKAGAGE